MFSSLTNKLLLALYVFIILSIPLGAYLVSKQQIFKTNASQPKKETIASASPSASLSPLKELQKQSETKVQSSPTPISSPTPEPSSGVATSFGPTLSFKLSLEGRPEGNQAARVFVGILNGLIESNPDFVLSFTVDLPDSGEYDSLSLAGLNSGSNYTAVIKGPVQIATSSSFLMSPSVSKLNSGNAITLLTGDLNEDNIINAADYSIAQAALGSTSTSANWKENADFNKDGKINSLDISYIIKNFGKSGASGDWVSPIPTASPSASLNQAVGGIETPTGYWMWVPR